MKISRSQPVGTVRANTVSAWIASPVALAAILGDAIQVCGPATFHRQFEDIILGGVRAVVDQRVVAHVDGQVEAEGIPGPLQGCGRIRVLGWRAVDGGGAVPIQDIDREAIPFAQVAVERGRGCRAGTVQMAHGRPSGMSPTSLFWLAPMTKGALPAVPYPSRPATTT